ncbi:MAG TPA: RNA-directed DNA polymerase [Tissierellaceae bacterium]|nr:RNA-directed DNA polymerase [Tissierellaceae bacterium]
MNKIKEKICSFEELHKAMNKCKKDVMWKGSVAGYVKNGLVNCYNLHNQLMNDTYKIDKYSYFTITEPKIRDIVSTRMKDRVFQKSMSDNYLYEQMTKGLIYDNPACQIGEGTDFSMRRLTRHLQKYFREHGLEGYVLQCDIADYFGSTRHSVAKDVVIKRVDDEWVTTHVFKIIESFGTKCKPNIGMGLGSEVTQLVQLAVLDDLDHSIKEELGIKYYIRYMDDFILIHHDKEYLKYCRIRIEERLSRIHLKLNQKKTQLYPLKNGIKFLGFRFLLTSTSKVIKKILKENVSDERRKLRKLKGLVDKGVLTKEDVNKCYESWKSHAKKGNTYTLVREMDQFYKRIWEV